MKLPSAKTSATLSLMEASNTYLQDLLPVALSARSFLSLAFRGYRQPFGQFSNPNPHIVPRPSATCLSRSSECSAHFLPIARQSQLESGCLTLFDVSWVARRNLGASSGPLEAGQKQLTWNEHAVERLLSVNSYGRHLSASATQTQTAGVIARVTDMTGGSVGVVLRCWESHVGAGTPLPACPGSGETCQQEFRGAPLQLLREPLQQKPPQN